MFVLNAATTADDYTQAATLECPGAVRVNVEIRDAAIYFQEQYRDLSLPDPTAGTFGSEVFAGRTVRSYDHNIEAIRFRSAVAGEPATVTAQAFLPDEVS